MVKSSRMGSRPRIRTPIIPVKAECLAFRRVGNEWLLLRCAPSESGGNRTLSDGLRTRCSTFELLTRVVDVFVGLKGIEPPPRRLKV